MTENAHSDYCQYYLKEDIKQAKVGIALLALPLVLFAVNDYIFFSLSETFYILLSLRASFLALTMVFVFYLINLKITVNTLNQSSSGHL